MDGIAVSKAVVLRSKHIKNLAQMSSGAKVRDDKIQINEIVIFYQLIVLMKGTDNPSAFFKYELTPTPTSLFKDGYLRKANKSDLAVHQQRTPPSYPRHRQRKLM